MLRALWRAFGLTWKQVGTGTHQGASQDAPGEMPSLKSIIYNLVLKAFEGKHSFSRKCHEIPEALLGSERSWLPVP